MRKPAEIREAEKRLRNAGAFWTNYCDLASIKANNPELAAECQRLMTWLSSGR